MLEQATIQLAKLKDAYRHGVRQIVNQHVKAAAASGPDGLKAANAFLSDCSVDVSLPALHAAEQPKSAAAKKTGK